MGQVFGSRSGPTYTEPQAIATKWFDDFEAGLPSQEGKAIAVTGCTSGTGLVCAKTCAKKGARHVVLLNRPSSRAEAAEAAIKAVAAEGTTVTTIACDLQSFASVKAAGAAVVKLVGDGGLDCLCNNAGVMALEDKATGDGYDVQMQTNHLSHFLLASECLPALKRAADLRGEARVVNHSSAARHTPKNPLDAKYLGANGGDLGGNGNSMLFGGARWERYHQTKLANAVFTLALADKFEGTKLKAACAAPGLAATNLQVTTHSDGGMDDTWLMRFSQSAEDGTMPLLTCCLAPQVENGDFWEPKGLMAFRGPAAKKPLEAICTKAESRALLWTASEAACGPFASI